jgi:mannose-6-phosphate isomerase-like protein (cupin superfamily)
VTYHPSKATRILLRLIESYGKKWLDSNPRKPARLSAGYAATDGWPVSEVITMYTCAKATAEKRQRKGMVSYFLLDANAVAGSPLAVTWVDVEPGGRQLVHHHPETQVYVIVQGSGLMHVGGEIRPVRAGDLIYIPSSAEHGIENNTAEPLSYVSAAKPAMNLRAAYDQGPHTPDAYES